MLTKVTLSARELGAAEDMRELRSSLVTVTERLGLVSFNISLNARRAADFMDTPTLTTWSDSELSDYANDRWSPRDPLLHRAAKESSSFLWHQRDWMDTEHQDYAEYLRASGLKGGITVPLSQKPGQLGAMTLLSVTDEPLTHETLLGAETIAQLAMARAAALSYDIPRDGLDPRRLNSLSGRQIEILHWVAQGKTNREIAIIMGGTRRTIDYHLQEILSKLDVSSRTQAVTLLISRES